CCWLWPVAPGARTRTHAAGEPAALRRGATGAVEHRSRMLSCTVAHATPRVLLAPAPPPAHGRHGEPVRLRSGGHARCSPAGLARRARLGRLRRALSEQISVLHSPPHASLGARRTSHPGP